MRHGSRLTIAAAVAMAGMAAPAPAEVLLDFAYNSLEGDYDVNTGDFTARAVNQSELSTSGNVRRLVNPEGTAAFDEGFAGLSSADILVDLDITNIVGDNADGSGTITITDIDGDTITGAVSGVWVRMGDALFFNGLLTNVFINDNGDDDDTFNGSSGSGFDLGFDGQPLRGAIVMLEIDTRGAFFDHSFNGVATDVSGQVVPTPGALAILGLGMVSGGVGLRRRRRDA